MKEHVGHRKRMRERYLANGINSLAEHEALELLLYVCLPQKDTNKLAHTLINQFGSIAGVFDASLSSLMAVDGIGESCATAIKVIRDSYYLYDKARLVRDTRDNEEQFLQKRAIAICNSEKEIMLVHFYDITGKFIKEVLYSSNLTGRVYVNNKDIITEAINCQAHTIYIVHNHPSGSAEPSDMDIVYTTSLYNTLRTVDVTVMDHVIVANNKTWTSMRKMGKIAQMAEKFNKI